MRNEAIQEGKVSPAGKNTPTPIILKQMSSSARRKIKKKLFRKAWRNAKYNFAWSVVLERLQPPYNCFMFSQKSKYVVNYSTCQSKYASNYSAYQNMSFDIDSSEKEESEK